MKKLLYLLLLTSLTTDTLPAPTQSKSKKIKKSSKKKMGRKIGKHAKKGNSGGALSRSLATSSIIGAGAAATAATAKTTDTNPEDPFANTSTDLFSDTKVAIAKNTASEASLEKLKAEIKEIYQAMVIKKLYPQHKAIIDSIWKKINKLDNIPDSEYRSFAKIFHSDRLRNNPAFSQEEKKELQEFLMKINNYRDLLKETRQRKEQTAKYYHDAEKLNEEEKVKLARKEAGLKKAEENKSKADQKKQLKDLINELKNNPQLKESIQTINTIIEKNISPNRENATQSDSKNNIYEPFLTYAISNNKASLPAGEIYWNFTNAIFKLSSGDTQDTLKMLAHLENNPQAFLEAINALGLKKQISSNSIFNSIILPHIKKDGTYYYDTNKINSIESFVRTECLTTYRNTSIEDFFGLMKKEKKASSEKTITQIEAEKKAKGKKFLIKKKDAINTYWKDPRNKNIPLEDKFQEIEKLNSGKPLPSELQLTIFDKEARKAYRKYMIKSREQSSENMPIEQKKPGTIIHRSGYPTTTKNPETVDPQDPSTPDSNILDALYAQKYYTPDSTIPSGSEIL